MPLSDEELICNMPALVVFSSRCKQFLKRPSGSSSCSKSSSAAYKLKLKSFYRSTNQGSVSHLLRGPLGNSMTSQDVRGRIDFQCPVPPPLGNLSSHMLNVVGEIAAEQTES